MIKISNLKLQPGYKENDVINAISKKLKINKAQIISFSILRRSLDARKKNDIRFVLTVKAKIKGNEEKIILKCKPNEVSLYKKEKYEFLSASNKVKKNIIIGAGPAGLFCGYTMIMSGLKPIIIERGEKVEDRIKSVDNFFSGDELNENSNIQFGEGGAGTFSDGKLNTGISDKRIRLVLETFVKFGAPKEILYEQKPHIGTDILRNVIINFRKFIEQNGGEFLFNTQFIDFETNNNSVSSITVKSNNSIEKIKCDNLVLAIGHSARDTFYNLYDKNISMQQKPFAMGARIEHSQEFINKIQYGNSFNNPNLPVADYKTAVHLENGRSVYSFCMCPGGYVVAAASECGMIAVNGMSNFKRDGKNANSAILVNVRPEDFPTSHPLSGVELQQDIERKAFAVSNSYKAPAQTLSSLIYGEKNKILNVTPTYKPEIVLCDLQKVLPSFIINSIKEGLLLIDKKMNGFADKNAILTAPETRSSSPIKILRDDNFNSNVVGIYPCGEGAGYAGGITSAAVDGIKVAEKIINSL